MNRNVKTTLLILLIGFAGPAGILGAVYQLGDAAFKAGGSSNTRLLHNYYYLDYLVISLTINTLITISMSFLGLLFRRNKISFSHIIDLTLTSSLAFLPMLIYTLLFTVIPVEGNIMGFFIFPSFIVVSGVCYIAFLISFIRKLRMAKAKELLNTERQLLKPYGIVLLVLFTLHIAKRMEGTRNTEIMSFKHDDFKWGIKEKTQTRFGVRNPSKPNLLFAYVKTKSKKRKSGNSLVLRKTYHSTYTQMQAVIPVNLSVVYANDNHNSKGKNAYNYRFNNNIEAINGSKPTEYPIYRLTRGNPQSLYLNPDEFDAEDLNTIASDIKYWLDTNEDQPYSLMLEAVALGLPPEKELEIYKNEKGEYLHVGAKGILNRGQPKQVSEYYETLGQIKEGMLYLNSTVSNIEYFNWNEYKTLDLKPYVNNQGTSLANQYQVVNLFEYQYNVEKAIKHSPNVRNLYLVNPAIKGIPESIGQLVKIASIRAKGVEIGMLPSSICSLRELYEINFIDIDKVSFPNCFGELPELRYLSLINCNLKAIPSALQQSKTLVSLDISKNNIPLIPEAYAAIESFNMLTVDYLPEMVIPKAIVDKKNLRFDFVTYNKSDAIDARKKLIELGKMPANEADQKRFNEGNLTEWNVIEEF